MTSCRIYTLSDLIITLQRLLLIVVSHGVLNFDLGDQGYYVSCTIWFFICCLFFVLLQALMQSFALFLYDTEATLLSLFTALVSP